MNSYTGLDDGGTTVAGALTIGAGLGGIEDLGGPLRGVVLGDVPANEGLAVGDDLLGRHAVHLAGRIELRVGPREVGHLETLVAPDAVERAAVVSATRRQYADARVGEVPTPGRARARLDVRGRVFGCAGQRCQIGAGAPWMMIGGSTEKDAMRSSRIRRGMAVSIAVW